MGESPSSETKNKTTTPPAPEVLKPHTDEDNFDAHPSPDAVKADEKTRKRRGTYRPSHKATFIGLGVVVAILGINAAIIAFVINGQKAENDKGIGEVTISSGVLDSLGVSRNPVGNEGTELKIGPNTRFNGTVTIGSDVSIAGQLSLNSKFSASDASLAKLEAGETSLGQLNVNGDGTVTSFTARKDLSVEGITRLVGPVTMSQLVTINNNLNVSGSLAVGGALAVNSLQVNSLVTGSTLTIGGHIITRGSAPGVSGGPALAGTDSVSISGNDAAGTVAVNVGAGGPRSGIVANVSFRNSYSGTPHVVITAVGAGANDVYVNRTSGGFSIGVGSLSSGGHAFDYIVMQ